MLRAMQGLSCPACAWTSTPARMTPWRDGLAVPNARPTWPVTPIKKGIKNYNYREMRAVGEFDLETNFAPHFRAIKHSDAGVQTSWEWTTGALEVKLFLVIFSGALIPNTCLEWLIFRLGWGELTCEKIGGVRHIWGIGITRPKICFPLRGTSRTPLLGYPTSQLSNDM